MPGHATLPEPLATRDVAGAAELVSAYFHHDQRGTPDFTGAHFETLGGGGDTADAANQFTATDFVAVSMLSVDVPAAAALRLLGPDAAEATELLSQIPVNLHMADATARDIGDGSPAWKLWELLRSPRDGLGPTLTSKLLARKRPKLLPIWDTSIETATGQSVLTYWDWYHEELAANDQELHQWLQTVITEAGVAHVSPLRAMDVIIWLTDWRARHRTGGSAG